MKELENIFDNADSQRAMRDLENSGLIRGRKLFGFIDIDPSMMPYIGGLFTFFGTNIRRYIDHNIGGHVGKAARVVAANIPGKKFSDKALDSVEHYSRDGFNYLLVLGPNISGYVDAGREGYGTLKQLAREMAPLMAAGGSKLGPLSLLKVNPTKHKLVAVERARSMGSIRTRGFAEVAGTIENASNLWEAYKDAQERVGEINAGIERKKRSALDNALDGLDAKENVNVNIPDPSLPFVDQFLKEAKILEEKIKVAGTEQKWGKRRIENEIQRRQDMLWRGLEEKAKNNNKGMDLPPEMLEKLRAGLSVAASSMITKKIVERGQAKYDIKTARDMLDDLRTQLKNDPGCDTIVWEGHSMSMASYITNMFILAQDNAVQLLNGKGSIFRAIPKTQHNRLLEISEDIVEEVRAGNLDVFRGIGMLIDGDKIVGANGMVVSPEAARQAIDQAVGVFDARKPFDMKAFEEETKFTKDSLKKIYNALDDDNRAFMVMMLGDRALLTAGIKKREIRELRKQAGEEFSHTLAEAIMGIAALPEAELKKQGFDDKRIELVKSYAQTIQEEGIGAVKDMDEGEKSSLSKAFSHVGYWRALAKRGKEAGGRENGSFKNNPMSRREMEGMAEEYEERYNGRPERSHAGRLGRSQARDFEDMLSNQDRDFDPRYLS